MTTQRSSSWPLCKLLPPLSTSKRFEGTCLWVSNTLLSIKGKRASKPAHLGKGCNVWQKARNNTQCVNYTQCLSAADGKRMGWMHKLSFYDAHSQDFLLRLSLGERGWDKAGGEIETGCLHQKLLLIVYRLHSICSIKIRTDETCIRGGIDKIIPQTVSIYIWYLCTATYRLSPPMDQVETDDFILVTDGSLVTDLVSLYVTDSMVFFVNLTHSWWLNLKKMMLMWNAWAQRAWELLLVTEAGGGWASPCPRPPSPRTRDHSWTPSQSRSLVTCVYTNTQTHKHK